MIILFVFLLQESILFERLSFSVEWYQEEAALMRQFLLNYYPHDKSVEMVRIITYCIKLPIQLVI